MTVKEESFAFAGRWGLVLGAVATGAAVALGWGIGWGEASKEVFGALVQTVLGSIVVAGLLRWNQEVASKRLACEALIGRIDRMGSMARRAKLLINAHRSAKTWTEQLRNMFELEEEVTSIVSEISSLYPDLRGPVGSTVNLLKEALGTLNKLIAEYHAHHAEAAWKQEQYEVRKKAAADWKERRTIHETHWEDLQRLLPQAAAFASRSDMLTSPDITTLEGRLLQAATLLWNQFRPT